VAGLILPNLHLDLVCCQSEGHKNPLTDDKAEKISLSGRISAMQKLRLNGELATECRLWAEAV